MSAPGPHGEGGEKLSNNLDEEGKHNQGGFEGNWKEKAVEKRKSPLSEADSKTKKQ